jgi:hypothetical protein
MRTLVCALSLWVTASFGTASAQTEVLGPDQWPKTMSEAVEQITSGMKEEETLSCFTLAGAWASAMRTGYGAGIAIFLSRHAGGRVILTTRPCS